VHRDRQGKFQPSAVWYNLNHRRPRTVRHTLEVVCGARFLVEGDAGLMRGFEIYLVTDHGGEDAGAIKEWHQDSQPCGSLSHARHRGSHDQDRLLHVDAL
jgi:hypothetical protein